MNHSSRLDCTEAAPAGSPLRVPSYLKPTAVRSSTNRGSPWAAASDGRVADPIRKAPQMVRQCEKGVRPIRPLPVAGGTAGTNRS